MRYRIESETSHRMRIRLPGPPFDEEQAQIIRFAFSGMRGVTKVTVYRATCGCAFEFACRREDIISRLDQFRFENVTMLAREEKRISAREMRSRRLDPALKRKLRLRILAETVADAVLPLPVQLGYHAWQMITLRNL